MRRDLADQRDVFFFYLAVISYANSTFMVKKGEDVDDSCSQNFFHSVIYLPRPTRSRAPKFPLPLSL